MDIPNTFTGTLTNGEAEIIRSFRSLSTRTRRSNPTQIRVLGELVSLSNGKQLWNQIGHAKSALTNHLCCVHWDQKRYGQPMSDVVRQMIEKGLIEFVPANQQEWL